MSIDPVAQYQSDHDLLVTLNERVSNLIDHVASVVTTNDRLTNDHEARIRKNEEDIGEMKASQRTWRFYLSTAIAVIGIIVTIIGIVVAKL